MPAPRLPSAAQAKIPPSLGWRKLLLPLCCIALFSFRSIAIAADFGFGDVPIVVSTPPRAEGELRHQRQQRRITFVPFPHKSLGSGEDAACRWTTRTVPSNSSYDSIQLAAFEEGMCLPTNPGGPALHVFSAAEARECLSPTKQGKNISLTISGDSYTRQLFIGLADVLLGRPSAQETKFKVRLTTLKQSNRMLAQLRGNFTSFPDVRYRCHDECYGTYSDHTSPFSTRCSECVNNFTLSDHAIAVVGAGVHVLRYHNRHKINGRINPWSVAHSNYSVAAVSDAINDIQRFLDLAKQTIYVSVPSYELHKVPEAYRNATHHTLSELLYRGLLDSLAPQHVEHPFVDVFQMTKSCNWGNCSYDGGHRARYVNRWKAQLLLNMICEVNEG